LWDKKNPWRQKGPDLPAFTDAENQQGFHSWNQVFRTKCQPLFPVPRGISSVPQLFPGCSLLNKGLAAESKPSGTCRENLKLIGEQMLYGGVLKYGDPFIAGWFTLW